MWGNDLSLFHSPHPYYEHSNFLSLHLTGIIQAYLGDTAGSIPSHHSIASHMTFLVPTAYKSYIYTILYFIECAITLCLKNVHT